MVEELIEKANELEEIKTELEEAKSKLENMKDKQFGSTETKKVKDFFSEIGTGENDEVIREIEEVRNEIGKLEDDFKNIKKEFLRLLTNLRFPFNQKIEPNEEMIKFPFKKDLDKEFLNTLKNIMDENFNRNDINLTTTSLGVKAENSEKAMEKAKRWVENIRETADMKIDKEKFVKDISNRDLKVQNLLYTLYEKDTPMTKGELENEIGVEKGELRGVLYYIKDNEPFLMKEGKKFHLNEIGKEVMRKYDKDHGKPDPIEEEVNNDEQ